MNGQKEVGCKWSGFRMGSEILKPNHLKSRQMAAILSKTIRNPDKNIREDMLAHYSNKLAHVQFVINCRYSIAQMCTREDTLTHFLGAPSYDDVMSQNELITLGL